MSNGSIRRPARALTTDQAVLRGLVRFAADVELYTIPLYMSALYSIAGRQAFSDGTVFPYMGPSETYTEQGLHDQRAYNVIYSVYLQEMLHLQLAMNIGNVIGANPALSQPTYSGTNTVPCLGKLGDLDPEFKNVKARLGPLDENAIQLFRAIELPDEDSGHPPPRVPLPIKPPGLSAKILAYPFRGIGNLYHAIQAYMKFTYAGKGDTTLFAFCYQEAQATAAKGKGQIVQVNVFAGQDAYSHMTLELTPGASVALATGQVNDMINGIVSEGEGSKRNNNDFVSPSYRPDSSDRPTDALWDAYSHYARFSLVKEFFDKVETWPRWRRARGRNPWRWEDFVADPLPLKPKKLPADLRQQRQIANWRAQAWNDRQTRRDLNRILNGTFDRFLASLNEQWSGNGGPFPMAAMQAISSRVTAVWAAGGVPEFKKPAARARSAKSKTKAPALHSCQGLNDAAEDGCQPGECTCATALPHTCAATNSCDRQGGCGYPVDSTGSPDYYAVKGSDKNFIPAENVGANTGGCGSPIPVAQVFHEQYGAGDFGPLNGRSVWDEARTQFYAKHPRLKPPGPVKPSKIRLVLAPS